MFLTNEQNLLQMAIEEIFVGTVDSLTAGCTIVSLEMEIYSILS